MPNGVGLFLFNQFKQQNNAKIFYKLVSVPTLDAETKDRLTQIKEAKKELRAANTK